MGREFIFTSPTIWRKWSYHASAYRDYGEPLAKPIVNVPHPISYFTVAQPESKATEPKGWWAWTSQGSAAGRRLSAHDRAGETTCPRKVFETPAGS